MNFIMLPVQISPFQSNLPITKTDDFDEGRQTLGLIFSCLKSLDLFLPEISLTLVIPDWWVIWLHL